MRPLRIIAASLVLLMAAAGCAGNDDAESLPSLPLFGKAPNGERYRLDGSSRLHDEDAEPGKCLGLFYSLKDDFAVVRREGEKPDPFTGGGQSCGPELLPIVGSPVRGTFQAECEEGTMYVYGLAREEVPGVELVLRGGEARRAREAQPPSGFDFEGKSFVIASDLRALPATVRQVGSDDPLFRVPKRSRLCEPFPGNPRGGSPFAPFPTPDQ